jgi:transcriptional regulator with XRE-family HTH domain
MNISNRIQNLRKVRGISQEELADKIGVSRQAVSKWESEQSTPDLDKIIIMSEYFDVTTDYLLKGIKNPKQVDDKNNNLITGQILYIASTAFLAIGLLSAFGSWYSGQSAESIWGSMIIQVVGIVGYFIGQIVSKAKASFTIKWFNIIITLFIPISLLVSLMLNRVIAPYPTDILSAFVFALIYLIAILVSFFVLKKQSK